MFRYFGRFLNIFYSMLTYMEILDAHYEEFHTETTDIFSKVLPNDFEVKADGVDGDKQKDECGNGDEKEPEVSTVPS